jgi:hypothetical protein
MLHLGDDDLISRLDEGLAEARRHEVNAFRRAMREDDFVRVLGPEEHAGRLADAVIRLGRPLAQPMNAAMDVRVLLGVVARGRVDHDLRLLAGRRIVEINQWCFPPHFGCEDWEILPAGKGTGNGERGTVPPRSLGSLFPVPSSRRSHGIH